MNLVNIIGKHNPYLTTIQALYENSFPLVERRMWPEFMKVMEDEKVAVSAIINEEQFAGFIVWWQLEEWCFIEHLALEVEQRGKGLGSLLIREFIAKSRNHLVLETELPLNEVSKKRLKFYENVGLYKAPFTYFQPTYRIGGISLEMLLMTSIPIIEKDQFKQLAQLIKHNVYDCWKGAELR